MSEILWLACGALMWAMADWSLRFWQQSNDRQRLVNAKQVLKKHGLTPERYLATIGEEDPELRSALDAFAFTGHIITNAKGEVVGKLLPRVEKSPHLRLVVSNN